MNNCLGGVQGDMTTRCNLRSWIEQKKDINRKTDAYFTAGVADYSPWARSGLPPVLVNKILLEHRYSHAFTYCL